MNKQYFSIPTQYDTSNLLQSDDLKIPVEILVMHDKINLNKSNFDFEVIDDDITKESIKNIPILGYIKKIDGSDSQDFAGHEMEVIFADGEIKVIYLERPIGVVPESNSYEYVEKDGKRYVKVTGYLWKDYLNSGYEILQENPNKSVSMEIVVDAYEVRKDGIVDIKAYRYTGITVLGDNVLPGMQGANMQVTGQFSENQQFSQEFYERVEKLNYELKSQNSDKGGETGISIQNKEGEKVDEKLKLLEKYNLTAESLHFSIDELTLEELEGKITEHFALLASQKCEELANALRAEKYMDRWGDEYSRYSYVDCKEDVVFAYDRQDNWNLYGFTYTMSGDKCIIDFASKVRKKFDIVDFVDGETMMFNVFPQEAIDYAIADKTKESEKVVSEDFEALKIKVSEYEIKVGDFNSKITEFESTINTLTAENSTLKTKNEELTIYRNKNEFEITKASIEDSLEEFELTLNGNEEFELLKTNINNSFEKNEIFIDSANLQKELFAIEGKVKHKPNTAKPKKSNFSRVSIVVEDNKDQKKDSYYGDAIKYIK